MVTRLADLICEVCVRVSPAHHINRGVRNDDYIFFTYISVVGELACDSLETIDLPPLQERLFPKTCFCLYQRYTRELEMFKDIWLWKKGIVQGPTSDVMHRDLC